MTENNNITFENEKNRVLSGVLYLVGTPIGNISDLSDRAKKVLSEVDFIAAEDTRHTGKLLSILGISRPMTSYYEENRHESGKRIIARLKNGESCALCTDAGMPAISDPGEDLVRLCADEGITVTCIPGATAAITALSLSAASTKSFTFMGFLPTETKPRSIAVDECRTSARTVILYEAPHRLKKTLAELSDACGGNRKIAICRELTKLNEEIIRTTLEGAGSHYENEEPRGEYVLILHGAEAIERALEWSAMTIPEHVSFYMNSGMSKMDAMKAAARDRGVGKGEIYKAML